VERRSGKYFGAGTALRQISLATGGTLTLKRSGSSANHVVLVRLTLDQFIFWPKLPPNAGFGIKNLQKNFRGDAPGLLQREGATPSRTHPQHGYTPCAGAQAPPLQGPRSRKPFPQIKIYHYTPGAVDSNPFPGGAAVREPGGHVTKVRVKHSFHAPRRPRVTRSDSSGGSVSGQRRGQMMRRRFIAAADFISRASPSAATHQLHSFLNGYS